jgi:hypothetical protein
LQIFTKLSMQIYVTNSKDDIYEKFQLSTPSKIKYASHAILSRKKHQSHAIFNRFAYESTDLVQIQQICLAVNKYVETI